MYHNKKEKEHKIRDMLPEKKENKTKQLRPKLSTLT
jgi:hypothetical protein